MDERSHRPRSRSPTRRRAGFRWKEKKRDDNSRPEDEDRGLQRGYRARSPPRRDVRDDTDRDGGRDRRRDNGNRDRGRSSSRQRRPRLTDDEKREKAERKEKKREKKAAMAAQSAEPMIVVNVNDRLGTKAAIPCLASDPIKLFKAQVAARIGREPHEILLKRQGERPFKDHLTLEDYGISHGVQLDLEVGTGD